ncbi:hypothetical protein P8A21_39860 (plasmid) [Streptomyces poriferorum]|uniref:hypothetical protein n=1 Tax=Streptomyces TaxID=1883 RepID=UPI00273F6BB3|nr:hypothetical protein [Streptomyces sp. Alt1]WLQ53706.1 hypothetical protein P8A21_39860 [Streptomyces sp. Alt1]
MNAEVSWGGAWEHPACGTSGEATWDDEDTASSGPGPGPGCGRDGNVAWSAEWTCHGCGDSGDDQFEDDTTTYSDHECTDEDQEAAA